MMRRTLALLLTLFVAWTALSAAPDSKDADEPVRLKKKKPAAVKKEAPATDGEKKPADPNPKEKKPTDATEPSDMMPLEEDENAVLERVAKNLQAAQEKLAQAEIGESTRQVQEDILKDLDALLRKSQQSSSSSDSQNNQDDAGGQSSDSKGEKSGASGKSGSQPSPDGKSSQGNSQQKKRSLGRGQRRQQSGKQSAGASNGQQQPMTPMPGAGDKPMPGAGDKPMPGAGDKPMGGQSDDKPGSGKRGGGGGKSREGAPHRAADVYKEVWGHLPESLRAEMNAYFNDRQFMAKYDELIKKYYRTIAEKGRPAGR